RTVLRTVAMAIPLLLTLAPFIDVLLTLTLSVPILLTLAPFIDVLLTLTLSIAALPDHPDNHFPYAIGIDISNSHQLHRPFIRITFAQCQFHSACQSPAVNLGHQQGYSRHDLARNLVHP